MAPRSGHLLVGGRPALLRATLLGSLALWLAACAPKEVPPPAPPSPLPITVEAPPEWRPGDRWVYQWTSGAEKGTQTIEVHEINREINTVRYHVVRIGNIDHYYTPALHWAASVRNARVEARMVPPQPWFVWPLEVGRRWTHQGVYEDQHGTTPYNDAFAVVAAETVEVPAGRFRALKVVRETTRRESDQYWYAPEVRWYVKWIRRRGDIQVEEQLLEYQAAPRLIPPPPAARPPSTTD